MVAEHIMVYRNGNYIRDALNGYFSNQKGSDKEGKDSSSFTGAGDSGKNEANIFTESNSNKKLMMIEPKTIVPGFFKRLFATTKKKDNSYEIEQNRSCDSAINTFNSLLEEENSLEALVGKAFSLNTVVTIQSIEDDGKPNLILSGSIPFKLTTKDGIVNKKVRVKGKLYSPRRGEENTTGADDKSYSSTQSLIRKKVNEQFKHDASTIEKVKWLTSHIFTQEEYKEIRNLPEVKTVRNKWLEKKDGHERIKHVTDIDERLSSSNIIELGQLKCDQSSVLANEDKKPKVPVSSITIKRSKSRVIRFTDGSDFKEKVGRNVITLTAPEGVLYMAEDMREESCCAFGRERRTIDVNCEDNMFTRRCFQMAKEEDVYALSRSLNDPKRSENGRNKKIDREVKDLDNNIYYPPGNYSHILADRYNPLTWIYQNFDKTKRFVQEFNC
ncbi:unnamed protein product [Nezara viridula]|uniref:Uncharacterized protein n=1 Tax=Nezara viridula TaxID=85310 RepID=A0A9P0H917_NEZVI|nr:unnamed protein product [Nezara viridula]